MTDRRKITLFLFLLSLCATPAAAQDYIFPLKTQGKRQLSANFGELRTTNLHTGIDIRTGGAEGVPVVAAADGYVYRIGIRPGGYGRAIYLAHADGTSTVYGHLSRFTAEIDNYVARRQYAEREQSLDIFPTPGMFTFRQGDVIAYSGNSGRSYGPHLHFEIRDHVSDRLYNPAKLLRLDVEDTLPPEIHRLYYFRVDTLHGVPLHRLTASLPVIKKGEGSYALNAPAELPGDGYFAIETVDRKNGVANTFAVYRITLDAGGSARFEYIMDNCTFGQAAYESGVAVYPLNRDSRHHVVRLAVMPQVALPFYGAVRERGLLSLSDGDTVSIKVEDDRGNESVLDFTVARVPDEAYSFVVPGSVKVDDRYPFSKTTGGLRATVPARSLYEPIFYRQEELAEPPHTVHDASVKILSPFYSVGDGDVPLLSAIELEIECALPPELRRQAVIARVNGGGNLVSCGGEWKEGRVVAKTRTFGTYCVVADTKAPQIAAGFKSGADMSKAERLVFDVRDEFSGISSYEAFVDGKWVILEYDYVRNRLLHRFDDRLCGRGKKHTILLKVADTAGNAAEYSASYYR